MMRLLLTVFFFEAGLVLVFLPWSSYWERNYFAMLLPQLQTLLVNDFVRGGVSGLGLVNVLAGVAEIWSFLSGRHLSDPVVSIRRTASEE
ncbi:MAG TPA: hypothetical protein VH436_04800 [Vicinamibacterales bacterium]